MKQCFLNVMYIMHCVTRGVTRYCATRYCDIKTGGKLSHDISMKEYEGEIRMQCAPATLKSFVQQHFGSPVETINDDRVTDKTQQGNISKYT